MITICASLDDKAGCRFYQHLSVCLSMCAQ